MGEIHSKHVLIALQETSGDRFERFGHDFVAAIMGPGFVPLGGTHDGGADGFAGETGLLEFKDRRAFVQISIQEDFREKIRKTVKRLREFGRKPKKLTYLTSRSITHIDREEDDLGEELGVAIRIRERNYIRTHINTSVASRAAFENHLRPTLDFLRQAGKAPIIARSKHVETPDVYVFLQQEVDRRTGDSSLVNAVIDAMILWSLEGTDPDTGRFMNRQEVEGRMLETLPALEKHLSHGQLNDRLQLLASKNAPGGRAIRWHKSENQFCLPFDTRKHIEEENAEDAALRIEVLDCLRKRLAEVAKDELSEKELDCAADYCLIAIQRTFEREGLSFAHFLSDQKGGQATTIAESLDDVMYEDAVDPARRERIADAGIRALRGALYSGTESERLLFSKLSRTYALLFVLQIEPRIVEYFEAMTADFRLFVGSDVIVRALSERFLESSSQMTRTTLRMAAEAGAKLILTEPVLNEVVSHIRATDREFCNHFAPAEAVIPSEVTSQANKILIRAYFYAKNEPERHSGYAKSWSTYIQQVCSYATLHKPSAFDEIRRFLTSQFCMEYESTSQLEAKVNEPELEELTERFKEIKTHKELAANDALMVLSVYAKREELAESGGHSEFGYKSWWLTGEMAILNPSKEVIRRNHGARFVMRPDFLLNFIALAPDTARVRETYRTVFPSMQGIHLSRRLGGAAYAKVMGQVDEALSLEPGRLEAAMGQLADQLKSDVHRTYQQTLKR